MHTNNPTEFDLQVEKKSWNGELNGGRARWFPWYSTTYGPNSPSLTNLNVSLRGTEA